MKQLRTYDFTYHETSEENMLDCILEALFLVINGEEAAPQEQAA